MGRVQRARARREACRSVGGAGVAFAACVAVASGSFIVALNHTTVAHVLFIQAMAPVLAALLAWLALGEPVSTRTAVAMGVAIAGVALMVGGPGGGSLLGDGLSLLMALAFAVSIVISRHRRDVSMLPATCLAQIFLVVAFLPFAAPGGMPGDDLVALAALGAGQIGLGLAFLTVGARLIPAAQVALITLLEVVLGPLWVWLADRRAADDRDARRRRDRRRRRRDPGGRRLAAREPPGPPPRCADGRPRHLPRAVRRARRPAARRAARRARRGARLGRLLRVGPHPLLPPVRGVADPWVTLSAVACATERLRIGPMVTPPARRRVQKLTREAVTLDHLSGGRLVLGLGLGGRHGEFGPFGDPDEPREQARMLDASLERLDAYWDGEFQPRPLQQPRIPVWLAARWPNRKPVKRGAALGRSVPDRPPLAPGTGRATPPRCARQRGEGRFVRHRGDEPRRNPDPSP